MDTAAREAEEAFKTRFGGALDFLAAAADADGEVPAAEAVHHGEVAAADHGEVAAAEAFHHGEVAAADFHGEDFEAAAAVAFREAFHGEVVHPAAADEAVQLTPWRLRQKQQQQLKMLAATPKSPSRPLPTSWSSASWTPPAPPAPPPAPPAPPPAPPPAAPRDRGTKRDRPRGGKGNPNVQWHCARAKAQRYGYLAEFLENTTKPQAQFPHTGDDSWGADSWGADGWGDDSWGDDSWGDDSWGA